MPGFYSSKLALNKSVSLSISDAQLGILAFHSLFIIRPCSSDVSSNLNGHSFTVSYLINSCGLTLKSAESASKRIKFETPERPDSVLRFLKEHGFTNSHISKIVELRAKLLLCHPERTLLPKFEFLHSVGVSRSDLPLIVSQKPELLVRSIKRFQIPHYNILKSVLVSDEKVVKSLKRVVRNPIMLSHEDFNVNLSLLKELGIPQSAISYLVTCHPFTMCQKATKFAEGVKKVTKIGFDPSKSAFVSALQVLLETRQKTWEQRMEVFRRWGKFIRRRDFNNFQKISMFYASV
ncbi:hypothetical protein MANES_04G039000v8 [Manihot esculenta]|uniref:Uncharacterized protein n=2 Tax=Manihot esculenta TaxID=3983 RepID=A0ACB7HRM8_MANES|nr:hypothetical protein MANES_04G039000v8 [Manihot esculenta]KAG8655444.1 hypothetical protein MANES_04G039000v8 [Manihot esculenta]